MKKVACVGILVADVMTKPVDSIPEKGLLSQVDAIEIYSGGNAMTAAINMRKMGVESAIVGKVGEDMFGTFLEQKMQEQGVNTKGLKRDKNTQTSASIVLSASDGERSFLHCVGTNATFSIDDVDWDVISGCDYVFVTGTYLMNTFDGQQTADFLKKCQEMGKTTLLDVCWDAKDRWASVLDCAMPYIDIFMPSIDEAVKLSGETEPEKIADVFFSKGVKKVVIKLGKHGAYLREEKDAKSVIIPTYSKIKAVDTTGAGDSFCSGFITGLVKGLSFEECGLFANAVGTHCVMEKGATTGIKSYEEIRKFMEEYE
ncbi:MAG: carbohydrate kinase family protein [Oscillospiraceae bacterium]|nr:carbohydrate kinase family protein [Oscillospiraceae bacterium]